MDIWQLTMKVLGIYNYKIDTVSFTARYISKEDYV